MKVRYQDRIAAYCDAAEILIPSSFYRHPASRYAVVDYDSTPPKLITKTWQKKDDVLYYLTHLHIGASVHVLDFWDRRELHFVGATALTRGLAFESKSLETPLRSQS